MANSRYVIFGWDSGIIEAPSGAESVCMWRRYHLLGIATQTEPTNETKRQQRNAQRKFERMRLRTEMRSNVNRNLPRNVTY